MYLPDQCYQQRNLQSRQVLHYFIEETPSLFQLQRSQDRATKIIEFLVTELSMQQAATSLSMKIVKSSVQ